MGGLIALFIVIVWFLIVLLIALFIANKMKSLMQKMAAMGLIIVTLLPLPLIDEILGKQEFEQLCRDNENVYIDKITAVGRTVYLEYSPVEYVNNKWLRIRVKNRRFLDLATNELVLSYKEFEAERTWFTGNSGTPFLFKGTCEGEDKYSRREQLFSELKIIYIQQSEITNRK
jgi:hypothetical protein